MTNTPSNVLRMATDNNTIRDNARILSKTVLEPLKGLEVAFEYTFDKTPFFGEIMSSRFSKPKSTLSTPWDFLLSMRVKSIFKKSLL